MSHWDYEASKHIAAQDHPFYALIMAAMRQADTDNTEKLKWAWPAAWEELRARYHAPGGRLSHARPTPGARPVAGRHDPVRGPVPLPVPALSLHREVTP